MKRLVRSHHGGTRGYRLFRIAGKKFKAVPSSVDGDRVQLRKPEIAIALQFHLTEKDAGFALDRVVPQFFGGGDDRTQFEAGGS